MTLGQRPAKYLYPFNQPNLEKEYWKQLAHSYHKKIQELEKQVDTLNSDKILMEQKIRSLIEPSASGITIQNLKVNNIQSGAAFNISENLYSSTKSDMDMDLGPNSMNIGDGNKMENTERRKVKLLPPQEFE